jgi:OmpA-OmpF porin, OOP family
MKKSTTQRIALTALASLSVCGVAQAQDSSSAWYISPSISRLYPDTDWNPDKHGNALGLKVGRALAPHWDLQLGLNTARSSDKGAVYRQTLFGADVLYLFGAPGPGFRPFLSGGLGGARDAVSGPVNAGKTSPYASAGFGARYQFNDKLALQADWKRVHSALSNSARTAFGFANNNNGNNSYLGLALNYSFGSAAEAPRPAQMTPPPAPVEMAAAPAPAPAPMPSPPPPAPAPAPAVVAAAPAPAPAMEKITMQGTELFGLNKSELRAPQPKLDELAAAMVQNPSINRVVVTGHTDRLGSDKLNNALSQRRAEAVKRYLVSKGVAAERIQAVGKGSKMPVKSCNDKDRNKLVQCLEANRRVEIEPVTFERKVR